MANDTIHLDQDGLEKFYQEFGAKDFELQSKIAESFGGAFLDLYFKSVNFIYRIITVIGVIAGFGFTALGFVDNFWIFMAGELLLLSAIALGLYRTQQIYFTEAHHLWQEHEKISKHFEERNKIFDQIFHRAVAGSISTEDIRGLLEKDKELLTVFRGMLDSSGIKPIKKMVNWILVFFMAGSAVLLISFLWNDIGRILKDIVYA